GLFVGPSSPVDIYEFELTEWSRVWFRMDFPRVLATPSIYLRKVDGGIQPVLRLSAVEYEGRSVTSYDELAPGVYQLTIRASSSGLVREMMYDMLIEREAIWRPIRADEFEYNDSPASASELDRGTEWATLHRYYEGTMDEDYYQ